MKKLLVLIVIAVLLSACTQPAVSLPGQKAAPIIYVASDDQIRLPTPQKLAKAWPGPRTPDAYGAWGAATTAVIERRGAWYQAVVGWDATDEAWTLVAEEAYDHIWEEDKGEWAMYVQAAQGAERHAMVGMEAPRVIDDCTISAEDEDGNALMPSKQDIACMVGSPRVGPFQWRAAVQVRVGGIWWDMFMVYDNGWQLESRAPTSLFWGIAPEAHPLNGSK